MCIRDRFEPNRDDAKMFFTNVFSFSGRHWVCEHAYQTTRRDLLTRRAELEPIFARHGLRTVSDTHLDVYKRQADESLGRSHGRATDRAVVQSAYQFGPLAAFI